jgi:hypothetical protein
MQMASTAYANAHFTIEQRLARWPLMCRDGSDSDELELTHESKPAKLRAASAPALSTLARW